MWECVTFFWMGMSECRWVWVSAWFITTRFIDSVNTFDVIRFYDILALLKHGRTL